MTRSAAPRLRPRRSIGLALAGGGPLGGTYEIGALLALADSVRGLELTELDVYVGVSSGSFVAAALANGISPAQMVRLFIDDGPEAVFAPRIFLRPALAEFARRAASVPGLALRAAARYLRNPHDDGALRFLAELARAVPTGVLDQRCLDRALTSLLTATGRHNDFRELPRRLFIVATHLDSGTPVAFGTAGHDHVPIAKAIQASAALPGMFPPVEIDGLHYVDGALSKTLHASIALEAGVDLLLCVNPLVPFDADASALALGGAIDNIHRGGLPRVLAQTLRAVIHSRMRTGMDGYRREFPDADIVLFEPGGEDADMFRANILGYTQRRQLCAAAFNKTRQRLAADATVLDAVLARHGASLDRRRLADAERTLADALDDPRPLHTRRRSVRQASDDLGYALDRLERWVAARQSPAASLPRSSG